MRYEGNIFRPPSEAYSLLVQVTVGCTHNKCTFCSMYKDKQFHIRKLEEVLEDLDWARKHYRQVRRIFLCDGDALALKNTKLRPILEYIRDNFPECERVTSYARVSDILHKSEEDLKELWDLGLTMLYIGAESGSDAVLTAICKGESRREIIDGVRKAQDCGFKTSVTFISGLAGKAGWEDHAVQTATMINEMEPDYVGLLTLMIDPEVPIAEEIRTGRLELLSPEEVVAETLLMLENIDVKRPCVFRSNHASNYLSLAGTLPGDRDRLIGILREAMEDQGMLKDERFRAL